MRNWTLILLCALALSACMEIKEEESEIKWVEATVAKVFHSEAKVETDLRPVDYVDRFGDECDPDFDDDCEEEDFDLVARPKMRLNDRFNVGGQTSVNLGLGVKLQTRTIPERFEVVFQTNQQFKIVVTTPAVYNQFKDHAGAGVNLAYKELSRVVYETKDGERYVHSREVIGYKYISATIRDEPHKK